jgi:transposase
MSNRPSQAAPSPDSSKQTQRLEVRSQRIGALPLINHFFERMQLLPLFQKHLPPDRRNARLDTSRALLVLVRNMLLSREPVYGIGEWAALHACDGLDLAEDEPALLNDDRLGRALDRVFDIFGKALLLESVRHVTREFQVSLQQLHNDSTSVSVYGAYSQADKQKQVRGRPTCAITFGHSKDHRPDLKQLLYILTMSEDGGIPVHVQVASGNTADDTTHQETWDLLHELVGGPNFLYVADCKLASSDNLRHIAKRKGRFVSVLPGTRREDGEFRKQLRERPQTLTWRWLYDVTDERGKVIDTYWACEQERLSVEGWRLWWFRSQGKTERDVQARARRLERAVAALGALQERLAGARTRLRTRPQVQEAVTKILEDFLLEPWLKVSIHTCRQTSYRQVGRGRPGPDTKYVPVHQDSFELTWTIDGESLLQEQAEDGVFPLITNEKTLGAVETLRAYKRQPTIEKRFSQFKSDFAVAPIWLKEVSRVQALLGLYFFVLLTQSLLERELRRAMKREGVESLPLYPEGRACRYPTARRVFDVFEPVQRHVVHLPDGSEEVLVTELTPLQRQILRLLDLDPSRYGR